MLLGYSRKGPGEGGSSVQSQDGDSNSGGSVDHDDDDFLIKRECGYRWDMR